MKVQFYGTQKINVDERLINMYNRKQLGIEINSCIFSDDKSKDIDEAEFLREFIEFIETKGYNFGGGFPQVDEDGNYIK
ncbi:hypothetical protein ABES25_13500 [Bacillus gobiensis]|uniref:hypothetical protein n=1 Tax=Bacillus gobiensis TaxID=1441095 RepID=UPI003D1CCAE1